MYVLKIFITIKIYLFYIWLQFAFPILLPSLPPTPLALSPQPSPPLFLFKKGQVSHGNQTKHDISRYLVRLSTSLHTKAKQGNPVWEMDYQVKAFGTTLAPIFRSPTRRLRCITVKYMKRPRSVTWMLSGCWFRLWDIMRKVDCFCGFSRDGLDLSGSHNP